MCVCVVCVSVCSCIHKESRRFATDLLSPTLLPVCSIFILKTQHSPTSTYFHIKTHTCAHKHAHTHIHTHTHTHNQTHTLEPIHLQVATLTCTI